MKRPGYIDNVAAHDPIAQYALWLEERYELLDVMARGLVAWAMTPDRARWDDLAEAFIDTLRFLDGVQEAPDGYVQVGWVCQYCDEFRSVAAGPGAHEVCIGPSTPMQPVFVDRRLA